VRGRKANPAALAWLSMFPRRHAAAGTGTGGMYGACSVRSRILRSITARSPMSLRHSSHVVAATLGGWRDAPLGRGGADSLSGQPFALAGAPASPEGPNLQRLDPPFQASFLQTPSRFIGRLLGASIAVGLQRASLSSSSSVPDRAILPHSPPWPTASITMVRSLPKRHNPLVQPPHCPECKSDGGAGAHGLVS
jgi:hypothetical protein